MLGQKKKYFALLKFKSFFDSKILLIPGDWPCFIFLNLNLSWDPSLFCFPKNNLLSPFLIFNNLLLLFSVFSCDLSVFKWGLGFDKCLKGEDEPLEENFLFLSILILSMDFFGAVLRSFLRRGECLLKVFFFNLFY